MVEIEPAIWLDGMIQREMKPAIGQVGLWVAGIYYRRCCRVSQARDCAIGFHLFAALGR
jgi:hypothetical protein